MIAMAVDVMTRMMDKSKLFGTAVYALLCYFTICMRKRIEKASHRLLLPAVNASIEVPYELSCTLAHSKNFPSLTISLKISFDTK
jgi:glucan phosphoethanolaminetransferase (alkaline phosphatase superfamily)